jgi:hypothetical protein
MNKGFRILFALTILVLASLACNSVTGGSDTNDTGSVPSGAYLTNVHFSLDVDDTISTTVYRFDSDAFYCFFDLTDAPEGTVVKGTWVLLSAAGYQSDQVIDTAEVTGTDGNYSFQLTRTEEAWPVGFYKIDLYVDGILVESPGFEVK